MITEEIVHIKGHPKKLIIFLHGYIDSPEYIEKNIQGLLDGLEDVAVHIPKSPYRNEKYPNKYQWFSAAQFDPNDERQNIKDWHEYLSIYNSMKPAMVASFDLINPYIDNCLVEYGLEDKDLVLCGYSQGGSLAIFISLMREQEIGGVVSFSGIFAPRDYLIKNHKSKQSFLLVHGSADTQVRFEVLDYVRENLQNIGCKVETFAIEDGEHRLNGDGIKAALNFIKKSVE